VLDVSGQFVNIDGNQLLNKKINMTGSIKLFD